MRGFLVHPLLSRIKGQSTRLVTGCISASSPPFLPCQFRSITIRKPKSKVDGFSPF
nr:MAG TPA: hypothetical protein [Caudoviricetes sp.]